MDANGGADGDANGNGSGTSEGTNPISGGEEITADGFGLNDGNSNVSGGGDGKAHDNGNGNDSAVGASGTAPQLRSVAPGPDGGSLSQHPDDTAPGIRGLSLLEAPSEARLEGGNFFSVLRFEPVQTRPGGIVAVALPLSTFTHSDPTAALSYEARLADGSPLPGWLAFDPAQLRFHGRAPDAVQTIEVQIVARDPAGHTARTKLTLEVLR